MNPKLFLLSILFISFHFYSNAQEGWENLGVSSGVRIDDVYFINADTGWAAGTTAIRKTTNGGQTWVPQYNSPNTYLRSIEFLNENYGFCGTLDGIFLRTTDGGDTWTDISAAIPGNAPGICGLSHQGQNVYGCGIWSYPAYFVQSYDAGETWQYQEMSEHAIALIEPLFFQADSGFVAGQDEDGGVILFTPDRGETWQEVHNTGVPGEYVWKLQMVSRDTLFASVENFGPNGSILVSHDGGKNWMRKEFNYGGNIQAIGFLNGSKGWVGGYFDGFHETNDGGETWQNIGIGNTLNRIFVVKPNLAYASGEGLYKFQGPEPPSATAGPMPKPDLDWGVTMQGNSVNIQLNLNRTNNVNIGLYTPEGRWLRNIYNGRLSAGEHRWEENLNLPAGIYLVGLQTNEGLSARKISLAGQ